MSDEDFRAGVRFGAAGMQRLTDYGEVTELHTLQFHWGGLFDSKPADGLAHLVRVTKRGTPGPTLCGIDRFGKNGPGWSVGGGVSGPGITHTPCEGCVTYARQHFPALPIAGMAAKQIEEQVRQV
jgi:hypothetical protein